jgi:hypothetical protein
MMYMIICVGIGTEKTAYIMVDNSFNWHKIRHDWFMQGLSDWNLFRANKQRSNNIFGAREYKNNISKFYSYKNYMWYSEQI